MAGQPVPPTSLDVLAEAAAVQSSSEETVSDTYVHVRNIAGSNSNPPSKEMIYQLFQRFKSMVAEKAADPELKGTPPPDNSNLQIVVYQPPQHVEPQTIEHNMSQGTLILGKPGARVSTKLTGVIFVDFEWPGEFAGLKHVKLQPLDDILRATIADRAHKYSVDTRLMGWKIERRQRRKGPSDTYYTHRESRTMMRSTTEAVNFMLFEAHPKDKRTPKRNAQRMMNAGDRMKRAKRVEEYTEEELKEFYRVTYENLQKLNGGNHNFDNYSYVFVAPSSLSGSPPTSTVPSPPVPLAEADNNPIVVVPPVVADTEPNPDAPLGTAEADTNPIVVVPPVVAGAKPNPDAPLNLVGPEEESVEVGEGIDEEGRLVNNYNVVDFEAMLEIDDKGEYDQDDLFAGLADLDAHSPVDMFSLEPAPSFSGFASPSDEFP